MENAPITIEKTFDSPINKLWKAITDKNEMKLWYFDLADFKPEVGFEFKFEGGTENQKYLHLCKVTETISERKLTYSWKYDGFEGISFVTFELIPEGEKTKLILTHKGLDSFPKNNPDFDKKNFEIGWTEILDNSLKQYLDKVSV